MSESDKFKTVNFPGFKTEETDPNSNIKVEIGAPYTGDAPKFNAGGGGAEQLMATVTCIAAAARLQALNSRIKETELGVQIPMDAEAWQEYGTLMKWWNSFGDENQVRLFLMMKQLAEGVNEVARLF